MELKLRNKVAFVTGASSGIGAAAAICFAQEGAHVVIGYGRNESAAQRIFEQVKSNGVQAWLCQMDITEPASVREGVRRVASKITGLDALVLCAGENRVSSMAEITPEEWNRVISVNLNVALYVLL